LKERVVELFRPGEDYRQALPFSEEAERSERFLLQVLGLNDK
jgi:hypothetical protein